MSTSAAAVALTVDEDALVQAFRAGTLANDAFHHRDHVRMAWLYVRTHGPAHAVTRFTDDLRAFAAAKGLPGLFHATITTAYLTLVAERMATGPAGPWEAFAAAHGDLLHWKPSVLDGYYTADRLWSDLARRQFLMPDLAPLPAACQAVPPSAAVPAGGGLDALTG